MIVNRLKTFQDLVESEFQVDDANGPACRLFLARIEVRSNTPQHEDFSLILRGPGDVFLPQGTYLFNHPVTGAFDCFLVPFEEVQDGFMYAAVFNLLN